MTLKIPSESLGEGGSEGFAALIEARIATLREYDAHEAVVRQHAADPDMASEDRWVTLAVPQCAFDHAIKVTENPDGTHTFEPDYEIVPPAPLPFATRKANLFNQVIEAEVAAINAVLAPGKVRAYQFREADIRKADHARWLSVDHQQYPNFDQYNYLSRPPEDTKFMEDQAAREDQRNEIQRWAANLHSEIEDLTEETIDAFAVKPFNG